MLAQDIEILGKLRFAFPDAAIHMHEIKKLSSAEQELLSDYLSAFSDNALIFARPEVQSLMNKIISQGQ